MLLYGDFVVQNDKLTLPHHGLKQREFVIYPLAEVAPDLVLPSGETMSQCQQQCPRTSLVRLEEYQYEG